MIDRLTAELGAAPRRIAVVRALQLGDVLAAIPALRALRFKFPAARITFVGLPWAKSFVARVPHLIDDYLEFPGYPNLPERAFDERAFPHFVEQARRHQFDIAIQMHGSGAILNRIVAMLGARRTAGFYPKGNGCPDPVLYSPYPETGHEVHRNLGLMRSLGIPLRGDHLEFPLFLSDVSEADELRKQHRLNDYIGIHPGARYRTRRWPVERFAAVADALAAEGYGIVLTGSADELELVAKVSQTMKARHVNLAGRTSLGGLGALLRGARLLVTNDTGVSHVASAVGARSVVIVMGSDPGRWAPLNTQRHTTLFEPIECRPCAYDVCPIGHACATAVTIDSVLAAARRQLRGHEARPLAERAAACSPVESTV
jgi:ADP-heptose:LPS heptosyltransferase